MFRLRLPGGCQHHPMDTQAIPDLARAQTGLDDYPAAWRSGSRATGPVSEFRPTPYTGRPPGSMDPWMTRARRARRCIAVLVAGTLGCLALPAVVAQAGSDGPTAYAPAQPYADLLVETAAADLRLPWQSIPGAALGVLGTRSAARVEALRALEEGLREAVAAAYEAAARAAARQGPVVGGSSSRSGCNGDFDCFKPCTLDIESDGNYGAVSPDGTYHGAWQFDQPTWNGAVSRAGYPEWSGGDPASAPPHVQDAAARQLYAERGNQPWGGRC